MHMAISLFPGNSPIILEVFFIFEPTIILLLLWEWFHKPAHRWGPLKKMLCTMLMWMPRGSGNSSEHSFLYRFYSPILHQMADPITLWCDYNYVNSAGFVIVALWCIWHDRLAFEFIWFLCRIPVFTIWVVILI